MTVQRRDVRSLLGFMTLDEAKSFQVDHCLKNEQEDDAAREQRWQALAQQVQQLAPIANFDIEARALTPAAQAIADATSREKAFTVGFGSGPHSFQSIRLDRLVARQRFVDLGHLGELAPPDQANEADLFEFCIKANPIDPPLKTPDGAITFSSPYSQNIVPTEVSYEVQSDHEVRVWATIRSRPNYVYVTPVNGRFIVQNGYHRAVALLQAGHERMPCLVRPLNPADLAILQQQPQPPGFFDLGRIMAPRPPMVSDFTNQVGSVDLQMRARNHILRVGFQAMPFEAPR